MAGTEQLAYSIRNLLNRKLRSSLTLLSIFIGIATIFIFISFGLGLYSYIEEISTEIGVDKLTIQAEGIGAPGQDDQFSLGDGDLDAIARTNGVSEAAGLVFGGAEIELQGKTMYQYLVGFPVAEKEEYTLIREYFILDLIEGRDLKSGDNSKVVLGYSYTVPNRLAPRATKIGDTIEINERKYRVIGFYDELGNPSDDANIYMTEDAYLEAQGEEEITYSFLVARVSNTDDVAATADRITRELRKERNLEEGKEDFFVSTPEDLIESFASGLQVVVVFVILIALISIIVSAINTSNTMFTSILERTREIGVLKAIGAKNGEILSIFLFESGMLGLAAGVSGVLLGFSLSYTAGVLLDQLGWGFLSPAYPWYLFAGCILFSTTIGILSGVFPAYLASKKNTVESLRYS